MNEYTLEGKFLHLSSELTLLHAVLPNSLPSANGFLGSEFGRAIAVVFWAREIELTLFFRQVRKSEGAALAFVNPRGPN